MEMIDVIPSHPSLESLAEVGILSRELATGEEVATLVHAACLRLTDARLDGLSMQSRFDLGHNAAHLLAHAALRWHGYRAQETFIAFPCLAETLGVDNWVSRLLSLCHDRWIGTAREGMVDIDMPLVGALLEGAELVLQRVLALDESAGNNETGEA